MKWITRRLIIAAILYLTILPGTTYAQQPISKDIYADMEQEIINIVNQHRATMNLPALQTDNTLTAASSTHSRDMADVKAISHDGFEERIGALLKKLKPANAGAENVESGAKSAQQAVDLWLSSTGHRKNIEGNFNLTGVGIVKGADGKLYFTQIFINKQ